MKRKTTTTKKYLENARAVLDAYMELDDETFAGVHVSISLGNTKIGKCLNVSLLPGLTCQNCEHCIDTCYAISSALRFPTVLDAWAKNTAIAKRDHDRFWSEVRAAIAAHPTYNAFRYHVAGDIPNAEYAAEMVKTAKDFQDVKFWTYSKTGYLNRFYLPTNFHAMKSTGFGVAFNPNETEQFHCVRSGQTPPENVYHCPGDCGVCLKAKRGCPYGENAWTYEH